MKRERRIRVLFVGNLESTFVKRDFELLKKHFDVKHINFVLNIRRVKESTRTMINLIFGVLWADLTFSWFAGAHAFWTVLFSKFFRRKSIVVVGGGEVAKIPEIRYGTLLNPKDAHRVKYVFENADGVLTVDESLKRDAIKNLDVDGKNVQSIPTGYDYEKFRPKGEKENLVLTVAYINNITIKRKGLETFIKAAEMLPSIKFVIIGPHIDNSIGKLKSIAGHNVEFTGFLSEEELIRYYQKAKVYCQLSRYEGLPNALCEAMLCECVPVGTKNCGILTAIGDTGFYVPYGDEKATAEAIKNALDTKKGKEARKRIMKMFPIERREKELKEGINSLK